MDTVPMLMQKAKRSPDLLPMHAIRYLAICVFAVVTQQAQAQSLDVRPTLGVATTYSDNLDATRSNARAGWVTELSPGLNGGLTLGGGRGDARFDIGLSDVGHESGAGWRKPALSLQAAGEVEALEDLLFLQANVSLQRQSLSPFRGRQSGVEPASGRDNLVRSVTIAPRVEFSMGAFADVRLEQRLSRLSGGGNALNTQATHVSAFDLAGARAFGPLDWGVSYRRTRNKGDGVAQQGLNTTTRLTLTYEITPQLDLRGIVGRESNRAGLEDRRRTGITGLGIDWRPGARTTISATVEDRFFGNGYDFNVSHRMARSTLQFSVARDYTTSPSSFESIYTDPGFTTLFDDPSFREDLVDPALRERAVREQLQYARDGVITNAQFIDQSARVSYTLSGVRNTLSLAYSSSRRESVSDRAGLRADDIFRDATTVTTKTIFLGIDHRLSPRSGIGLSMTRTDTDTRGGVAQTSRRDSIELGFDKRLGHRTTASISYRHERLSSADGFSENTLSANLNMRF